MDDEYAETMSIDITDRWSVASALRVNKMTIEALAKHIPGAIRVDGCLLLPTAQLHVYDENDPERRIDLLASTLPYSGAVEYVQRLNDPMLWAIQYYYIVTYRVGIAADGVCQRVCSQTHKVRRGPDGIKVLVNHKVGYPWLNYPETPDS